MGVVMGLGAAVGVMAYARARARRQVLSHAVAMRMGLEAGADRSSLALELVGLLVVAFAVGTALALAAAVLIAGRLDVVPTVPPAPVVRIPWTVLGATAVGLVLLAWAAAAWANRVLARANVAEEMRGDD